MRTRTKGVEVFTSEVPLLGDHLSTNALGHQTTTVSVTVHLGLRPRKAHLAAHDRGAHRHPCHALDTGRHDDVVLPGHDALRTEVHRLLRRTALTIDGGRRNRLGPPSREQGVTSNVEGLFPHLHNATGDDVVDQGRVEVVAVRNGLQRVTKQIDGVPIFERAISLSARGTDGINDDCSLHVAP